MTIQEALQNIDVVVSNARMNRQEHTALQQSISIVAKRCEVADKLEEEKNGRANDKSNISGANKKDSE
jgi:hypothetical protein